MKFAIKGASMFAALLVTFAVGAADTSAQELDGLWVKGSLAGKTVIVIRGATAADDMLENNKFRKQVFYAQLQWNEVNMNYDVDIYHEQTEDAYVLTENSGTIGTFGDNEVKKRFADAVLDIFEDNGALVEGVATKRSLVTGFLANRIKVKTAATAAVDEVQSLTHTKVTAGTYTLALGVDVSADIAFDADAAAIQVALEALAGIGAGNVVVAGDAVAGFTVTFQGALAGTNVDQLVVDNTNLTGTVAAATDTEGAAATAGVWKGNMMLFGVGKAWSSAAYGAAGTELSGTPKVNLKATPENKLPDGVPAAAPK